MVRPAPSLRGSTRRGGICSGRPSLGRAHDGLIKPEKAATRNPKSKRPHTHGLVPLVLIDVAVEFTAKPPLPGAAPQAPEHRQFTAKTLGLERKHKGPQRT